MGVRLRRYREYLPYGTYVLAEQQPFKAQWMVLLRNRYYRIDPPKEIVLPSVYEDGWAEIPDRLSGGAGVQQ
ncbi:MAG: hypothetical protein ACLUD2_20750 [Clostridium sp.]